jgi:hypothetical protein
VTAKKCHRGERMTNGEFSETVNGKKSLNRLDVAAFVPFYAKVETVA